MGTKTFNITMDEEMFKALKAVSDLSKNSVAATIRIACKEYLDKEFVQNDILKNSIAKVKESVQKLETISKLSGEDTEQIEALSKQVQTIESKYKELKTKGTI